MLTAHVPGGSGAQLFTAMAFPLGRVELDVAILSLQQQVALLEPFGLMLEQYQPQCGKLRG